MKTGKQGLAVEKDKRRHPFFRPCLTLATVGFLLMIPRSTFAKDEPTIIVRLFNYSQAARATVISAERQADQILTAAGVHAVWIDCLEKSPSVESKKLCERGWDPAIPSVRLLSGRISSQSQDLEFGLASIPIYVTVSYDNIERRARRDNFASELPVILGCVIAHELGHLLLRDSSHSRTGIMQPEWGREEIRQALMGGFRFEPEQAYQMKKNVRVLEDHRQESASVQSTVATLSAR